MQQLGFPQTRARITLLLATILTSPVISAPSPIAGDILSTAADDCSCDYHCAPLSERNITEMYFNYLMEDVDEPTHLAPVGISENLHHLMRTPTHELTETQAARCHGGAGRYAADRNLCPEVHWISEDLTRFPQKLHWVTCLEGAECRLCSRLEPRGTYSCARSYVRHKVLREDCCGCYKSDYEVVPNRCYCAYSSPPATTEHTASHHFRHRSNRKHH